MFKKLLLIISAGLGLAIAAGAQQAQPVPVDAKVRLGQLDNGLTYYIRHNEEPKGQANFYIAQTVGSILEDESQRGLAHFLEHMCFNGTEHFAGNGVIKYCESIGVKFGADLNAYTSIDETVYNIDNVPIAKVPSAVDSCLWILHDWADGLLLTDEDIDHERGVIHEEWRTRLNAQMRMIESALPKLYPGNLYGQRMPIGLMEVVDNFPYQVLRDYYEKWYRPDQQGIVVVGDFDVDQMEAKIKDIFGTIAKPVDPAERFYVPVEKNEKPIICVEKDKEQPYAISMIFLKHDAYPAAAKSDMSYLVYEYALGVADRMINQRLDEYTQMPDPPFMQAGVEDGDYFISKTESAYTGQVVCDGAKLMRGLTTTYREMLRAIRNGFTESEYERAKSQYLADVESAYNQREKITSKSYCQEYVRHFIDNEPIPGIETEFALSQQLAPNIPVQVVNQVIAQLAGQDGLAVFCMLPDKEGVAVPTAEEIEKALADVAAEDIAPYEDKVSDEPLINELPTPGKVVRTKDAKFGYKLYTLSNGVNVYIKNTDFNAGEIVMRAFSHGGMSYYPASDGATLKCVSMLMGIGGVGNFSLTELNKALAGKKVSVNPFVDMDSEGVSGKTTPKDLETMLQLNYLYFTALRQDDDAFASWRNRIEAQLINSEAQPMRAFNDTLTATMYQNNPRMQNLKSSDVPSIDYARALEIARERFANAADFTFVFAGKIDEETAIPLIEQYIGSLPAGGKKERYKDVKIRLVKGQAVNDFERQMEVPMATVFFADHGKMKYNLRNDLAFDIAAQALSTVLLEEVREKEGGTYSISANGRTDCRPYGQALMQIVYQTNPEKVDALNGKIDAIVKDMAENGPSEENLAKVKEYKSKKFQENQTSNSYFNDVMVEYLRNGVDFNTTYEETLGSISAADVKAVLAGLLKQDNHSAIIMRGVK